MSCDTCRDCSVAMSQIVPQSIEKYEFLTDKHILYKELEKGINSLEKGEKFSEEDVYDE